MNYLYEALQSSADRAARSDTALPGTIARPNRKISSTTINVQLFGSVAEIADSSFIKPGQVEPSSTQNSIIVGWKGSFKNINETTPDDSDFVSSHAVPMEGTTTATAQYGLGSLTDPTSSVGHVMRYRYKKSFSGGVTIAIRVRLLEGSTQRATRTHFNIGASWKQRESVLTAAEANAISDYTDLRLEFRFSAGGTGSTRKGRISWAEFEGGA